MAALTSNADRRINGGVQRNYRSALGSVPFMGSYLCINAQGYFDRLTAGLKFAGICERAIPSREAATSNGGNQIVARAGVFTFAASIAGVLPTDVVFGRRVYALNDNDLTLTSESGSTYIGRIVDTFADFGNALASGVLIQAETFQFQDQDLGLGECSQVLADAAATLTASQLDMILYMPNTAARTVTLPPVASCTGRGYMFKKTTSAAFALTLQANAAETIDGANTYATATAQNSLVTIRSDGTQWIVTGKI